MKIACLQFAPQLGDVSNNLIRADAVLSKVDPADLEGVDLLVLPEMAFTGYNFKSLQHITPFLEPTGAGLSAMWARTAAIKYGCAVAVGYPEKVDVTRSWPTSPEYYNSLILVNSSGETLANYRKSFLYYTDETWALEGPGFLATEITDFGEVAFGICMDINPYKFEAPWHAFEFAHHVLQVDANLVIVSMAWLTREDINTFTSHPEEPDMDTLTYWVQRLEPVIRAETEDEIIFVFCNRCGSEDDALFAGTSTVLGVMDGEVSVYGLLGRGTKELLVVDTDTLPFGKLVYRPEPPTPRVAMPLSPGESQSDDTISTTAVTGRETGGQQQRQRQQPSNEQQRQQQPSEQQRQRQLNEQQQKQQEMEEVTHIFANTPVPKTGAMASAFPLTPIPDLAQEHHFPPPPPPPPLPPIRSASFAALRA